MSEHVRAAIYVRISSDRDGDSAGVQRQEDDSRALAERLGWNVAHIYIENDVSAFKKKRVIIGGESVRRVIRPEFRAMLKALASGELTGLVAYDLDRIARDPRDLEDLIDVIETAKIPARSVTGSLDLGTDAGITMARVMVAMANKSSRDTSRRVSRALAESAARGEPRSGGARGYGRERDGTIIEAEAETLRRISSEILAGRTCGAIASDLNTEGVPTVTGKPWTASTVAKVIKKPANAGLQTHLGEIIGETKNAPIIGREKWERVLSALAGRSRGTSTALMRWLNGVLICGRCGAELAGKSGGSARHPVYACPLVSRGGCARLGIVAIPTEEVLGDAIVEFLQRPANVEALRAGVDDESAIAARAEAKLDEAQLKELAGVWARKEITMPEYREARSIIEARLAKWSGIKRATMPESVRSLQGTNAVETFLAMSNAEKREVAGVVFGDGVLVMPFTGTGSRAFDVERLSVIRE